MGMVGGGRGAFIGGIHRIAANMDGQIELVCGSFSSDPQRSIDSGADLFLPPERCYQNYEEMMEREAALPKDQRMDFVSIVTPNYLHFRPSKAAMDHGFPVILDKPLCYSLEEAIEFRALVEKSGLPFALTHTYTGYPMVKQARALVRKGVLGKIRKVTVEYPQGWLTDKIEGDDHKQASWRSDPARSGISNCYGDIGTHAANMAEYVSGLKITKVLSKLSSIVEGRQLDDDANVLLEFDGEVPGLLHASQVSAGEENCLKVRVYGEIGGLEWNQEDNNSLHIKWHGKPAEKMRAGGNNAYLEPEALANLRTPAGHPEGYLEAFANIYKNFADAIWAWKSGKQTDPLLDYPGIDDGVHGMALITAVVESSRLGNVWVKPKY